MANLIFNPTNGQWINLDKPGGQVFFVDGGTPAYRGKGGSANNSGLRPEQALTGTTTSSSDGLNAVMDKVANMLYKKYGRHEESIIPQLRTEFKEYDFIKKNLLK